MGFVPPQHEYDWYSSCRSVVLEIEAREKAGHRVPKMIIYDSIRDHKEFSDAEKRTLKKRLVDAQMQ